MTTHGSLLLTRMEVQCTLTVMLSDALNNFGVGDYLDSI